MGVLRAAELGRVRGAPPPPMSLFVAFALALVSSRAPIWVHFCSLVQELYLQFGLPLVVLATGCVVFAVLRWAAALP